MSIASISNIDFSSIKEISGISQQEESASTSFSSVLNQMMEQVNETGAQAEQDLLSIATGEADNLHTITMNIAKADLALQTTVQVRNKVMDAYNEVMRMTL